METIKTLSIKSGLSEKAIRWRADKLNIKKEHEPGYNNVLTRIFSEDDAEKILNYKKGKPGRKK